MKPLLAALCCLTTLALAAPAHADPAPRDRKAQMAEMLGRLSNCVGGEDLHVVVRLRVSKRGWAEVADIKGAETEAARTCVRVSLEELHIPADVRGAIPE